MKRFSLAMVCAGTLSFNIRANEALDLDFPDLEEFSSCTSSIDGERGRFFDDLDADQFLDNATDDFLGDADFVPMDMSRNITPAALVAILTSEEIAADGILQEDFYLRTTPFNKRNVVDLPALELGPCCRTRPCHYGLQIFWNQTSRMRFTKGSTNLACYLALSQQSLIQKLATLVTNISGGGGGDFVGDKEDFAKLLSKLDVDKIFSLFRTMAVQERRIGFAFRFERVGECATLRTVLPLYYQERNFFLTDKEKEAAERELAEAFGESDTGNAEEFQDQHFVSDKIGFGDLRIEVDAQAYGSDSFLLRLGAQFTFPTAFAFKKGLKGNSFPKPCNLPTFDLLKLGCILEGNDPDNDAQEREDIFEILSPFFLEALDRLSANLLETGLGNGGHVGIGIVAHTETCVWKVLEKFCFFPGMKKKRTYLGMLTLLTLVGLVVLAFYTAATPLLGCCANCTCGCGTCGACGGAEDKSTAPSNIVIPFIPAVGLFWPRKQ